MEIRVRADRPLAAEDELVSFVGFEVLAGLGPCAERVLTAHVQVTTHRPLQAGPAELLCLLEVHPREHPALAVTHRAATRDDAVRGAVGDMRGVLERMFRRIDARPLEHSA